MPHIYRERKLLPIARSDTIMYVCTEKLTGENAESWRNMVTGKVVLSYLNYLNTIITSKCLLPHVSILVENYPTLKKITYFILPCLGTMWPVTL